MMGFRAAEFNRTLRNLAEMTPEVIEGLATAIGLVQVKTLEAAKRRHGAATVTATGSRKRSRIPSRGGKNRQKNPDGSPRYGDITGNLTGSIRIATISRKRGFLRGRVRAGVGSKVGYAMHVEFGGTVARKASRRAASSVILGFRRPHPFMRPALQAAQRWERKNKVFQKAVVGALKKAVK